MRKCQIILISIVSLLIIAVSSCKTTDTLATRETEVEKKQKSEFFQKIMAQYPQFSTMSSKCNVSIANISSKADKRGVYTNILTTYFGNRDVANYAYPRYSLCS